MGTAFVILVLLALCGFIAYLGDLIGRRLGKKRLSVFGMRPKHTAILLTIVTGVVIAGVTFGAALLSVPGFRDVVTRGERMAQENRGLEMQNQLLESQNRNARRRSEQLTADVSRLQGETGRLQATNTTLQGKNTELSGKNRELAGKNQALDAQNRKLQQESGRLLGQNQELQGKNGRLAAANARLAGENGRILREQARLRSGLATLRTEATRLRQETQDLKGQKYVFRRGFQISSLFIPPNPPADLLRDQVRVLLYQAAHHENFRPDARPVVQLVPPDGFSGAPSDQSIQDFVVRKATQIRDVPLALRVVAAENTVEGRPVKVRLDWYANERVLSRGDALAETRIDGAASTGAVLQSVIFFLKDQVRSRALAPPYSMVPRGEDLGEFTYDELLETCARIRAARGFARVVARARQDTFRSGPLYVDLEVIPVGSAQAQRE